MVTEVKGSERSEALEVDMLNIKKDTIIEKQKTLEDLRKNCDLIESDIQGCCAILLCWKYTDDGIFSYFYFRSM